MKTWGLFLVASLALACEPIDTNGDSMGPVVVKVRTARELIEIRGTADIAKIYEAALPREGQILELMADVHELPAR